MRDENILSIDQSISKCAVTIWNNNEPIYWNVFKSGGSECKKKLKSVSYFQKEIDKIDFISDNIITIDFFNKISIVVYINLVTIQTQLMYSLHIYLPLIKK
jgi:hypothetical protein